MGKRRTARERALQVLYELEFNDAAAEDALRAQAAENGDPPDVVEYAARLVRGVAARREDIDRTLAGSARNWRIERMTPVDRSILRLAVYELLEDPFLEPPIIINEAIEIAKRYGGEESAAFINGVLDAVGRALRPASAPPKPKTKDHEPRKTQPPSRSPRPARSAGRGAPKRAGARPRGKA